MEGTKYEELHVPTPAAAPEPPKQPQQQVDADGNPIDAGDIDLQIDGQTQKQEAQKPASLDDQLEDSELVEFESAPFLLLASKYFQKSAVWFVLISAFCAFRAASAFTVSLAYIHVGIRVVQLAALMLKKRVIAKVAYGVSTIIIVMMFFAAMIDETHIIDFF